MSSSATVIIARTAVGPVLARIAGVVGLGTVAALVGHRMVGGIIVTLTALGSVDSEPAGTSRRAHGSDGTVDTALVEDTPIKECAADLRTPGTVAADSDMADL